MEEGRESGILREYYVLCQSRYKMSLDIKGAAHNKRRIKQRLVGWYKDKFQMLILNTVMCAEAKMGRKKGTMKLKEM